MAGLSDLTRNFVVLVVPAPGIPRLFDYVSD